MNRLIFSVSAAVALMLAPPMQAASVQAPSARPQGVIGATLRSAASPRAAIAVAGVRFEQHRGGGGAVVGRATARTRAALGRRFFVRPFFVNPFFFSGFGLGFAYDPFFWGWGYPFGLGYPYWGGPYWGYPYGYGYGYGYGRGYRHAYGSVKLDVKPRDAEVYLDGYYVGQVRDFTGLGHHLDVDSGEHKIEIRAPGYQPLDLDMKIAPDRTVNYRGELKKGR